MVEYGRMIEAGCVAFSDDGKCVSDAYFARKAMEYLKDFNVPYIEHCEECRLTQGGVMHEGRISFNLGVSGSPNASEDVIVERNIALSRLTGTHVHMAHLSSRHSVEALRRAQGEGLRCTGEVTPHHLILNESCVESMDANFKMAPPLRSEEDRISLVKALQDGVIQSIATDHAPHSLKEKGVGFANAANGVIGLETAYGVCMRLVQNKELSHSRLIEALTFGPASVMQFKDRGEIKEGQLADFAVIDSKKEWTVDAQSLFSKSSNSPFLGMKLRGRVVQTFVGAESVFELEKETI
jgi:dihydroorotase